MTSEIFNIRLKKEDKELIKDASNIEGISIGSFMKRNSLNKAREVLDKYSDIPNLYKAFLENSNNKNISLEQFKEALRRVKEEEYREAEQEIKKLTEGAKNSN